MTTPYPVVRNSGDNPSFFASEQENPSNVDLITTQADPRAPQANDFDRVSDPIQPTQHADVYVRNFDPNLYDLRETSHLMRLIRAITGPAGIGGLRKQNLVSRLSSILSESSFLDLDQFYGAIFGLQRHSIEAMPLNQDGTVVDPYTDLANSDLWDEIRSRDARYRSRIHQLAKAINMGATYQGMKAVAEAVLSCDVTLVEAWATADTINQHQTIQLPAGNTFGMIESQYRTYGGIKGTYGSLSGTQFGQGNLPLGARSEVIFTPQRIITDEERYQLQHVLEVLSPSNVMVTIAAPKVVNTSTVNPRVLAADSENWQVQSRITPAVGLIDPTTPIYDNAGPYSQARPAFSEYSGEKWTYNPTIARTTSYQVRGDFKTINKNEETIVYRDGSRHVYSSADSVMDTRQALAQRLSGEGSVTAMPYSAARANFETPPNTGA